MHPRHLAAPLGSAVAVFGALLGPALPGSAVAQPSPMPTGGPSGEEEPKPEGIAEAAPKAAGLLTTTPTLPPPSDRRKKFEVFLLDGYLRTRGDWLKNLHLGFIDLDERGGAPFPRPFGCNIMNAPCNDTVKSANMRLRLEPTVQLSETIGVHAQADLFDNYVLGPLSTENETPTVQVKRAWAEVATALGNIKFGRMPDHFGLGMVWNSGRRADTDYASWETLWQTQTLANVGGNNPVGYDLDADQGSTADRLMFTASIPGVPLRAAAALDWAGQDKTSAYPAGTTQQHDLDDSDDHETWMLAVARIDAPSDFTDRLARGRLALNYAARVQRKTRDWYYDHSDPANVVAVPVNAKSYLGSAWLKIGWNQLLFEAEVAGEIGSIGNAVPFGGDGAYDIRTLGAVGRLSSKALEDKLGFGVELGAASGQPGENDVQGRTHIRGLPALPAGSDEIRRFVFNPEYKIDLILFRELIGAVSNAVYGRPWLSYDLTKSIRFHAQNVTAAAIRPVSTPGNDTMWGLEFDADIAYRGGGFTAGLAYGGFFPLSAMNHPATLMTGQDQVFANNTGDADNAHTFQARLSVEF